MQFERVPFSGDEMKSVSASIITLSGVLLWSAGVMTSGGHGPNLTSLVGAVLLLYGLVWWQIAFLKKD